MSETKPQYQVGKSVGKQDIIVWDIETFALPEAFQRRMMPVMEEPKTKGAKSKAEKEAEWLSDAALHAERSRVALIGLLLPDNTYLACRDENESALLHGFWHQVEDAPEWQRFVGFNTTHFDVPFLIRRSYINGVKIPPWILTGRGYVSERFVDLMRVWQAGDSQERISLDRLAKAFGLPGKTGDGSQFGELWATDREKAIAYCKQDLELTKAVAERMLT